MEYAYNCTMGYHVAMKNYVVEPSFLKYGLRKNSIKIS